MKKKCNFFPVVFAIAIVVILLFTTIVEYGSPAPTFGDEGNYVFHGNNRVIDYFFNEGSGNQIADDSGNGNTLYKVDGTWLDGRDREYNAIGFDGTDDYLYALDSNDFDFADDFAIVAVVYIESNAANYMSICDKRGHNLMGTPNSGYYFGLENGKITYCCWSGMNFFTIQGSTDYRSGGNAGWHVFAVRRESGTYKLYADPTESSYAQKTSSFCSFDPAPNSKNFQVGRINPGGMGIGGPADPCYFDGIIDSLNLYEYPDPSNMGWGMENFAFFGFDEKDFFSDSKYVNDRLTWDYHCLGVRTGCTTTTTCIDGNRALEFNGIGDHVSVGCGNSLDFEDQDEIYIEIWFKFDTYSANQFLIDKYLHDPYPHVTGSSGYSLFLENGKLRFELTNDYKPDDSPPTGSIGAAAYNGLTTNTWYHTWARYDGTNIDLYIEDINSTYVGSDSKTYSGGIGDNEQPLFFGKREYAVGSDDFFDGIMDEVIISGLDL